MKTSLFFVISILFCLCGVLPKLLYMLALVAYVIYCVRIFKKLKTRFLSYPLIVFSLFSSFLLSCMQGAKGEDATALSFVFLFAFMFMVLPIMFVVLAVGASFDIRERKNKQKIQHEIEDIKNE